MTDKLNLTPQEELFLDYLFDGESVKHPDEAKVKAGYPQDYPWLKIVKKCSQQLIEKYDAYLAAYAPKGLAGLMSIIDNPYEPGSAVKLKAVIELLDRAGVVRKEKTEVAQQAQNYVFVLPAKQEIED